YNDWTSLHDTYRMRIHTIKITVSVHYPPSYKVYSSTSPLDLLGEPASPNRLSHPARRGPQRYKSHHRFDAEERTFRVRNGEGRIPVEIAKGNQRATNFDASADRASGAKRPAQPERRAPCFRAGRDVAFARHRFADGGNVLSRGFTRHAPARGCRQRGNRRNGRLHYRSDESDE